MTENWSVVRRQDEASRWLDLSLWAFWLRRPEALDAPPSDGLANKAQQFRRLGQDLHVLEYDLTSILFAFKTAYQVDYQGGEHLSLKKFSIVYHTDNFYVRVHKVIEDVEALLALLGGVDPARRPRKGDPSRREAMEKALKTVGRLTSLQTLRQVRENTLIKEAVEARNMFVHLYRHEPDSEWRWAMLAPEARIREYDHGPDVLAEELRRLAEPEHLDNYADERANRLLETLRVIQEFRDRLYGVVLRDVAELVRTRSAETQERYLWLIDLAEFWRDVEKSVGW